MVKGAGCGDFYCSPHPTTVHEAFRGRDNHMAEGKVDSPSFPTHLQSTNELLRVGQADGENPLQLEKG